MKNYQAIILIFVANTISGVAQGISMIAIPWYFARQMEMTAFGIFFMSISLVSLFWSPYSGTLVDKYNRKQIFLVINMISGVVLGAIACWGHWNGGLPLWIVALAFCLTTLNYNVHYPNLYAFIQEITESKYFGRITSFLEIQSQSSSVIAGACAAVLLEGFQGRVVGYPIHVSAWSIEQVFFLDSATYFIAFGMLALIRFDPIKPRNIDHGSIVERLRTGFRFLKSRPNLFWFGLFSYAIFVSVLISTFFLFATYVNNHLQRGGEIYALSEITYALGAILSGILIRRVFRRYSIPKAIIVMTLAMGIGFILLFTSKSVILFVVLTGILGLTNAGTRILRVIYLFYAIPNEVFGRAMSIFYIAHTLFRVSFLALFSLHFFTAGDGIVFACLILGTFLIISGLILSYLYPQFDHSTVKDR